MSTENKTWQLIHAERQFVADELEGLRPDQWAQDSLCAGWSVQEAAGHIVAGAEQTPGAFFKGLALNGFRFNVMIDKAAKRVGKADPDELIRRLRARTTTTNHPPGPANVMLGEVVVHGQDIRRAIGLSTQPAMDAMLASLDLFKSANFPVGTKSRIAGLQLKTSDADWTHGEGPQVVGPAASLLSAITGRKLAYEELTGEGADTLRSRIGA
jgi:uncharacterized protein (TIGR03083 family)